MGALLICVIRICTAFLDTYTSIIITTVQTEQAVARAISRVLTDSGS